MKSRENILFILEVGTLAFAIVFMMFVFSLIMQALLI